MSSEEGLDSKKKEYHSNGKLKYEGEYLNGERHGKNIIITIVNYYLKENI